MSAYDQTQGWNGSMVDEWQQPRRDLVELGERARQCLTLENSPIGELEVHDRCDLAFMAAAGIEAPEDR